jgi:hypothetical protein
VLLLHLQHQVRRHRQTRLPPQLESALAHFLKLPLR